MARRPGLARHCLHQLSAATLLPLPVFAARSGGGGGRGREDRGVGDLCVQQGELASVPLRALQAEQEELLEPGLEQRALGEQYQAPLGVQQTDRQRNANHRHGHQGEGAVVLFLHSKLIPAVRRLTNTHEDGTKSPKRQGQPAVEPAATYPHDSLKHLLSHQAAMNRQRACIWAQTEEVKETSQSSRNN